MVDNLYAGKEFIIPAGDVHARLEICECNVNDFVYCRKSKCRGLPECTGVVHGFSVDHRNFKSDPAFTEHYFGRKTTSMMDDYIIKMSDCACDNFEGNSMDYCWCDCLLCLFPKQPVHVVKTFVLKNGKEVQLKCFCCCKESETSPEAIPCECECILCPEGGPGVKPAKR